MIPLRDEIQDQKFSGKQFRPWCHSFWVGDHPDDLTYLELDYLSKECLCIQRCILRYWGSYNVHSKIWWETKSVYNTQLLQTY